MTEESLEEMAQRLQKGTVLRKNMDIHELKQAVFKIVKSYDPNAEMKNSGGHSYGIVITYTNLEEKTQKVPLCIRRKGKEKTVSLGLLKQTISSLHEDFKLPELPLQLYIRGKGKHLREFKRRFENEYRI